MLLQLSLLMRPAACVPLFAGLCWLHFSAATQPSAAMRPLLLQLVLLLLPCSLLLLRSAM